MTFDFQRERILKLESFIVYLDGENIDTGHAKQFFRVGEWGLAFREVYSAAKNDGNAYRYLETELEPMNVYLATYKHHVNAMGYPL